MADALDGDLMLVDEISADRLGEYPLVIIVSPTHGGFPTENIHHLVKVSAAVEGIQAADFDNPTKKTIFGEAALEMVRNLRKAGAKPAAAREGYLVVGMDGPLMDGALERAVHGAQGLGSRLSPKPYQSVVFSFFRNWARRSLPLRLVWTPAEFIQPGCDQ